MIKTRVGELNKIFKGIDIIIEDLQYAKEGKHTYDNGIYYTIDNYETSTSDNKKYESHRKYIDIQIILEGSEIISVKNTNNLSVCEEYDEDKDIIFYYGDNGNNILLEKDDALILLPEDGHMPGLYANEFNNLKVLKAVIKIPYELYLRNMCLGIVNM